MARCGRCGSFLKYQDNESEDGICLWYHLPIPAGAAYEERKCDDFISYIKDMPIVDQLRLKIEKTKLQDNYHLVVQARFAAVSSLIISLLTLSIMIWNEFFK